MFRIKLDQKVLVTAALIAIGSVGYLIGKSQNPFYIPSISNDQIQKKVLFPVDSDKFPILSMPLSYVDGKSESFGAVVAGYNVVTDADYYRSYPSTNITLNRESYTNTPRELPPIQSDSQIFAKDPNDLEDTFRSAKKKNIQQYGDLARRFVGKAYTPIYIYDFKSADVDNDGQKETILYLNLMGANVGGESVVIVKGDKVIFSENIDFATLIPAKNGNGFFLEWNDNYKKMDGYMTTRFIYEDRKFVPIYEQQVRYIRIKDR